MCKQESVKLVLGEKLQIAACGWFGIWAWWEWTTIRMSMIMETEPHNWRHSAARRKKLITGGVENGSEPWRREVEHTRQTDKTVKRYDETEDIRFIWKVFIHSESGLTAIDVIIQVPDRRFSVVIINFCTK